MIIINDLKKMSVTMICKNSDPEQQFAMKVILNKNLQKKPSGLLGGRNGLLASSAMLTYKNKS